MSPLVKLETAAAAVPAAQAAPPPKNVREAAQQFEALLITQMLKGARDGQGGWLGSGEDPESATAAELAEEQFAQALAHSGGLGLSARIVSSLCSGEPSRTPPSQAPASTGILHRGIRR